MTHYLTFVPYRTAGDRLIEVDCWLKHFDVVAASCICGWRMRFLTAEDLGVNDLDCFYGDPTDDALSRLTAELDSSEHAAEMVPALRALTPLGPAQIATRERLVSLLG